jgi:CRISPR-associated protein (TIGR03984 family)
MSESVTLHGCAKNDLRLPEALEACLPALEGQETIALLYSPSQCELARLKDRKLLDCRDKPISLDDFFEARVFNEQSELRWLNDKGGLGRAALLSASPIPETCRKQLTEDVSITALKTLPQQTYLLWGEGVKDQDPATTKLAAGWSRLTTARIGPLNVPIKVPNAVNTDDKSKMPRVLLRVCEYLKVCDDHGNVAVVEERLLKLEVA